MESWERKARSGRCWTERDARAAVASWQASGVRIVEFARRHGIAGRGQRLGWWCQRLSAPAATAPAMTFAQVHVNAATSHLRPSSDEPVAARILVGEAIVELVDVSRLSPEWMGALVASLAAAATR